MNLSRVIDLSVLSFPQFRDERGVLVPVELHKTISFTCRRIFWIYDARVGELRGGHAHKICNQFMICIVGRVTVTAFDGLEERAFALSAGCGLHIPPMIFAIERFDEAGSILAVICDEPYDINDYIDDRGAVASCRELLESEAKLDSR
jgi:dTDP-4-dehydrorhamnose 3,5-epimerase-like enzyme